MGKSSLKPLVETRISHFTYEQISLYRSAKVAFHLRTNYSLQRSKGCSRARKTRGHLRQDEVPERAVLVRFKPFGVVGSKGIVVCVSGELSKIAAAGVKRRFVARRIKARMASSHFERVGVAGTMRYIALVERRCHVPPSSHASGPRTATRKCSRRRLTRTCTAQLYKKLAL